MFRRGLFIFLLFVIFAIQVYGSVVDPLSYLQYSYSQALAADKNGDKQGAKNWFGRYISLHQKMEEQSPDSDFIYAEKRLANLREEIPVIWESLERPAETPTVERKKGSLVGIDSSVEKSRRTSRRERRKPSLSAQDLIAKAEKAENAGQFSTARRYYRLAVRLGSTDPEVQNKIKKLDEIIDR